MTCKPMGKFAENLNLGKRVLPPPRNTLEKVKRPLLLNLDDIVNK